MAVIAVWTQLCIALDWRSTQQICRKRGWALTSLKFQTASWLRNILELLLNSAVYCRGMCQSVPSGFVQRALCAATLCLALTASTTPRAKPNDYPAQSSQPGLVLAGEFYGRSAPTEKSTIFTDHYLVVEVAVYPASGSSVQVNPSEMRLYINGAKYGLLPQGGSLVAGTLKWYGYEQERGMQIGAGPIHIPSQPRQGPTFPGDPTDRQPTRPEAPESGPDSDGNGQGRGALSDDPAEALPKLELAPGEVRRPISGYLYFYWKANTKKLRNVELRWEPLWGEPPKAVLKLVSRH